VKKLSKIERFLSQERGKTLLRAYHSMQSDSTYITSYPSSLRTLLAASGGDFSQIPERYLNFFEHEYASGDVSFIPLARSLENVEMLESWEVDEVIEILSRVNPEHWPDSNDIVSVNAEAILSLERTDDFCDYVEDNLGTSQKVEKVLKVVLEEVFGKGVTNIRDNSGNYPSSRNNFLQEADGTFAGTFQHDQHSFIFEIAPTEGGWICTYRLSEKSLDKLEKRVTKKSQKELYASYKSVRKRAWG
jgi:hypothetical protein